MGWSCFIWKIRRIFSRMLPMYILWANGLKRGISPRGKRLWYMAGNQQSIDCREIQTNLIRLAANATILKSRMPCFQREMLVVP